MDDRLQLKSPSLPISLLVEQCEGLGEGHEGFMDGCGQSQVSKETRQDGDQGEPCSLTGRLRALQGSEGLQGLDQKSLEGEQVPQGSLLPHPGLGGVGSWDRGTRKQLIRILETPRGSIIINPKIIIINRTIKSHKYILFSAGTVVCRERSPHCQ